MLFKKMLRDLGKNKSQFITIFLMVFLAVFAFAGVHAYMDGMKESAKVYYENQNLEDLWITSENITDDNLEKIKNLDNVNDVERQITIKATVLNSEKYTNPDLNKPVDDLVLECNFIETNRINQIYLVGGADYKEGRDGIFIDYYLANKIGIKMGDKLELSMDGTTFTEEVAGLIEVPDHVYFIKDETEVFPTHTNYGFAYLYMNEFPKDYIYTKIFQKLGIDDSNIENKEEFLKANIPDFNIEDYYQYPFAIVDVHDTSKLQETKKELKEKIDGIITVIDREDNISWSGYQREAEEGETYSGIFSGLFVFIAILSVVTTMNRFIRKERTQIGTLKALGIKRFKITLSYVSYGFVISVIAGILGIVLGNQFIGETFLKLEMEYYEIPYYKIATYPIVYYVTVGIIAVITLVTYLSCRKVLKEPAAEALRVERPKIKVKKNSILNKGIFTKLSFGTKWNLRDIARSKGRTLMALVGIAGCTMLVVVALGMFDSMNGYMNWEFNVINQFDYKLSLSENYTDEEYNEIVKKYGDATSQSLGVEFKNKDNIVVKQLTVNDADEFLKTTNHDKEVFKMKDTGLYVTEKMAKIYDLEVGDIIEWHVIKNDTWYKTKIVGFNRDPQMQQFFCTKGFFDTLDDVEYKADCVYTNQDLSKTKEISGVNTIQSISSLREGVNSMLGMMYTLIYLLIGVSVVLAFVIIYNLGVLSFGEKGYQFATLKVLGFKDKSIKKIFIKQNIWISIVAILLALPTGYYVTDYIFQNAIGDTYDFNAFIKPITYIASSVGMFVVSYFVNQFLARKVNKIDMVSSLKGNE